MRDTLVAYHAAENSVNGWEGVIEDITEQRSLAQNLRRTNGMLQALVTYLPTGVFFVQGPIGQPILVNQRARQLLGKREDLAAGIAHLSEVYRLHRPDGSLYPVDELPVAKALRHGTTSMANDIVVHRADGRRVPLITWAAPVDWTGMGNPDAAVWVLEDLTALQQAETARRESEARLRGVIETMAEGVVVQNQSGVIIECNPAACAILGLTHEQLLGRPALGPEIGCLREDGSPFPRADQPDLRALRAALPGPQCHHGCPGRGQGRAAAGRMRWIFVNCHAAAGRQRHGPQQPRAPGSSRPSRISPPIARPWKNCSAPAVGAGRPARQRHRPRFQQPPDRDDRPGRPGAEQSCPRTTPPSRTCMRLMEAGEQAASPGRADAGLQQTKKAGAVRRRRFEHHRGSFPEIAQGSDARRTSAGAVIWKASRSWSMPMRRSSSRW